MATKIFVNTGPGNGLLPDGTKPLAEPMSTDNQLGPVTFISGQFHKKYLNHQSQKWVWIPIYLKFHLNLPGANELRNNYNAHKAKGELEKSPIIFSFNENTIQSIRWVTNNKCIRISHVLWVVLYLTTVHKTTHVYALRAESMAQLLFTSKHHIAND